jgi:hypothetical protein
VGCGCLAVVFIGILIPLSYCAFQKSTSKEATWLRACEDQISKTLPYPDTYQTSALADKFQTVPELSDKDKETVVWDFFYEGEKPPTVVGQASNRPLLKGVGQCKINKSNGSVKAEKIL